jgi:hypothetical protein
MLWNPDGTEEINDVPHQDYWRTLVRRLSQVERDAIEDALNTKIDADMRLGKEIQTSSWMPGNDWTGGPYEPIWSNAARHNEEVAGMMFGLMVWHTFMHRDEDWTFHRYENLARGLVYFVIHPRRG